MKSAKMQYNKKFSKKEVVTILAVDGNHCLVSFPSGTKLCTRLSSLYPLK